jgi:hypothetical protein
MYDVNRIRDWGIGNSEKKDEKEDKKWAISPFHV